VDEGVYIRVDVRMPIHLRKSGNEDRYPVL
jgi:hypothetical protein